jgi:dTDP-4-amino-4,6-dideoxygalactose transaminase
MQQKYLAIELGGNHRLDAIQAAVLRAKLPHLDRWTSLRRQNASAYLRAFRSLIEHENIDPDWLSLPRECDAHVWHQLVVRSSRREQLRAHLASAKISSEIYYPHPLHLLPAFAEWGYRPGDFPEAERASRETLALPMYPELGEARRQRVIAAVAQFVRGSRNG